MYNLISILGGKGHLKPFFVHICTHFLHLPVEPVKPVIPHTMSHTRPAYLLHQLLQLQPEPGKGCGFDHFT